MSKPALTPFFGPSAQSGTVPAAAGARSEPQSLLEVLNALGKTDLGQVHVFVQADGLVAFKRLVGGAMHDIAVAARHDLHRIRTGLAGSQTQAEAAAALANRLSSIPPAASNDPRPA